MAPSEAMSLQRPPLDLVCYIYPGWRPRLRAASPRRDWMDASPESFAYRCLPLNIANAHGWEILSPCGFEAIWNGGPGVADVTVHADPGTPAHEAPVALFGQGTFTIHIQGLFRTSPGCNLWVGGPPNRAKDGVAPLGGVIETDWAPYTFTMNWRFTRPNQRIRFEENEPVGFLFPLPRDLLDTVQPRIAPIDEEPELKRRFEQWSQSRDRFQADVAAHPPASPGAKWQKFYYRGTDAEGAPGSVDHRTKLRLPEFAGSAAFLPDTPPRTSHSSMCPVAHTAALSTRQETLEETLAALERLRGLSSHRHAIPRKRGIGADEFLDLHFAANWPLLLAGEVDHWPARVKWTPDYLIAAAGELPLQTHTGVTHAGASATLAEFIAQARSAPSSRKEAGGTLRAALAWLPTLVDDVRGIDRLLTRGGPGARGWLQIDAAGSGIPLQQQVTNQLLVQMTGHRRVLLVAPGETPKLSGCPGHRPIRDLTLPNPLQHFPQLRGLRIYEVVLAPGDALFVPLGWWRQIIAPEFSVSIIHGNFFWPN